MTKRLRASAPRRFWTAVDDAVLRDLYPDFPTAMIAREMQRSLSAVYARAAFLNLTKSQAYRDSPYASRLRRGDNVGARFRFQKGHVPANKGLRRPGWSPGRMRETQFKKGVRRGVAVTLYKPIGTERLSKDGYLERKVNDNLPLQARWRAVHLMSSRLSRRMSPRLPFRKAIACPAGSGPFAFSHTTHHASRADGAQQRP